MTQVSTAFEVYQFMSEKNIIIAFTGYFDHLVTTSLLKNIKNKLSVLQSATGIDKKVYNVLVESIENISKYSNLRNQNQNIAMLLLCKSDNHFTVITGNHILNSDIPTLKQKLDKVKSLNPAELKKMYREQMLSKRTHENSAGLGIIDIAIKSDNQIKYDFKKLTDLTSFYLFQTEINIQK
jgi:hypothetical protein